MPSGGVRVEAWSLPKMASENVNERYHEFLRAGSMSAGLYRLSAGSPDLQKPHEQDELYYVVTGQARFESEAESVAVGPGSLLFVEKRRPHRFVDIVEDLLVLVMFAPEES